jgi:heme/copper-type cytochrome/quinol oxidase subunit 2
MDLLCYNRYMFNSKKILSHILAASLLALILGIIPFTHFVAEAAGGPTKFPNPIQATSLSGLLRDLLKIVIALGAIVVVFFLILAGFKYVTARGDTKQIESAHATLTWTVIGGMVVLGAQVIADAIQGTVNELR